VASLTISYKFTMNDNRHCGQADSRLTTWLRGHFISSQYCNYNKKNQKRKESLPTYRKEILSILQSNMGLKLIIFIL